MKRRASIVSQVAILSVLAIAAGCFKPPDFKGAQPVLDYLSKAAGPGQAMSFDVGEYQGGWAVIGQNGEAFWTKDGKAYYVNAAAKNIAPGIEKAPENVQFDDAFKQAAEAE
jgi:hypothetical protein